MFFFFFYGDFGYQLSDEMGMDSDGNLMMNMGGGMAMDMDSGDLHIVSGWDDDDDDGFGSSWNDDDNDDW